MSCLKCGELVVNVVLFTTSPQHVRVRNAELLTKSIGVLAQVTYVESASILFGFGDAKLVQGLHKRLDDPASRGEVVGVEDDPVHIEADKCSHCSTTERSMVRPRSRKSYKNSSVGTQDS